MASKSKKEVIAKKIKLVPCGDKEEIDRVYQLLRDAQYKQYICLNTISGQYGSLLYRYNKELKNPDFQEEVRAMFRNTNPVHDEADLPIGFKYVFSSACRKVQSDYSTAIRNGLMKGERTIPAYKRTCPLIVRGVALKFSKEEDGYYLGFVNKIKFKIVTGSGGKNNYYIKNLMEDICNENPDYKVCDSSILVDGKNIILNLTVSKQKEAPEYKAEPNIKMGIAMGYTQPLTVCISNGEQDEYISFGDALELESRRMAIQETYHRLQAQCADAKGGRGRGHKLKALANLKNYEKNMVRTYNHAMSKAIVDCAKEHNVGQIIIESVSKERISEVMLRNWSYHQLQSFIDYKAKMLGDITVSVSDDKSIYNVCSSCGCVLEDSDIEKNHELLQGFTCSGCGKKITYSENKARNLVTLLGN